MKKHSDIPKYAKNKIFAKGLWLYTYNSVQWNEKTISNIKCKFKGEIRPSCIS